MISFFRMFFSYTGDGSVFDAAFSSDFTGNKTAAPPAMRMVSNMVRVPEERADIIGSFVNIKLPAIEIKITPANILFSLAGGTITARNIP